MRVTSTRELQAARQVALDAYWEAVDEARERGLETAPSRIGEARRLEDLDQDWACLRGAVLCSDACKGVNCRETYAQLARLEQLTGEGGELEGWEIVASRPAACALWVHRLRCRRWNSIPNDPVPSDCDPLHARPVNDAEHALCLARENAESEGGERALLLQPFAGTDRARLRAWARRWRLVVEEVGGEAYWAPGRENVLLRADPARTRPLSAVEARELLHERGRSRGRGPVAPPDPPPWPEYLRIDGAWMDLWGLERGWIADEKVGIMKP